MSTPQQLWQGTHVNGGADNAAMDAKKQQLIAYYKQLYAQQGMDPQLASTLANEIAQREAFGGAYPKSPGDTLNDLQSEANLQNESRYGQLLDLNASGKKEQSNFLSGEYAKMMGLAGSGLEAGLKREGLRRDDQLGDLGGNLAARGLGNTTIKDSLANGINNDSALREEDLYDRSNREKLGVEGQYSGDQLGVLRGSNQDREGIIERRTDQAPDLGLYMNMLSQPGNGGGSFSGGGHFAPSAFGSFSRGGQSVFSGALQPPRFATPSAGANLYGGGTGSYTSAPPNWSIGQPDAGELARALHPPTHADLDQIAHPLTHALGGMRNTSLYTSGSPVIRRPLLGPNAIAGARRAGIYF